jgi:hypothetical protein
MPGTRGYGGKYASVGEKSLAEKAISVKLDSEIDAIVRTLSNTDRANWLRRVITEAAQQELMGDPP